MLHAVERKTVFQIGEVGKACVCMPLAGKS